MPQEVRVDVAIIGAGTAGLGANRAARKQGSSTLLIDPGPFGTTCARVGCMPSKLLIAAADAAHDAGRAELFGVDTTVSVDGPRVMARVQAERDRFAGFVVASTDRIDEAGGLLRERARLTGPNTLQAGETTVHFERLVIATGGEPVIPPPFRVLPREDLLTNEEIFDLDDLPESLLVIGLGVIGLELGQAMHRLGVRTTLVGVGGAVGPLSDPEVLASAREHLGSELDLHPEYELKAIEPVGRGARLHFVDSHGNERDETFARVLMAAGRRSTLRGLGLEALGIEPDERGRYPIDPGTLQLGDLPVFVAGDVNNLHPLLHEAVDDGRIAGSNAGAYPEILAPPRRTSLGIVFTHPQIAVVGSSFASLADCAVAAGSIDYGDQGRARVQGVNKGLVRIYADAATRRLVGAEMFGPQVEHTAHLLAWAIQAGMTVDTALSMPFYHPVVEEGLRTALRDLAAQLKSRQRVKCQVTEHGVGS